MKVFYEQKGRLLGATLSSSADTNLLSSEEKQKIEDMVRNAKFFDFPSNSSPPNRGAADYYRYRITVETEQQKHTVETTDLSIPSELRPLIQYFRKKAVNNR
jgi:hypothetical protein